MAVFIGLNLMDFLIGQKFIDQGLILHHYFGICIPSNDISLRSILCTAINVHLMEKELILTGRPINSSDLSLLFLFILYITVHYMTILHHILEKRHALFLDSLHFSFF